MPEDWEDPETEGKTSPTSAIVHLGVLGLLVWLSILAIGANQDADWVSAAFTVYSSFVALVALVAAAAAFYISYVPYRRWIADQSRRPKVTIWAAIEKGGGQPADRIYGSTAISGRDIDLKVVVENSGTAPVMGGILNIVFPAECEAPEVRHGEMSGHRLMPNLHHNSEINGDSSSPPRIVRFSVVERDFTPNHFIYWIRLRTPKPMRCPIYIELSGDPPPHASELIFIETAGWSDELQD